MSVTFLGSAGGGSLITLPNPIMGDGLWNDNGAIVRKSRGLEAIAIYEDWLQLERYTLTWRWLSSDKLDELAVFLQANLGRTFIYTDYRGVENNIIILSPEAIFVQEGRDGCDSAGGQRNLSLELEVI